MFWPTVPEIAGELAGQLVAIGEAVIQTRPVAACALGITYDGTNKEAARTRGIRRNRRLFNNNSLCEPLAYRCYSYLALTRVKFACGNREPSADMKSLARLSKAIGRGQPSEFSLDRRGPDNLPIRDLEFLSPYQLIHNKIVLEE